MKLNIRSSFLGALLVSIAVTSCLKDKAFKDGEIQSVHSQGAQKVIELSTAPHDTTGFLSRAYPISTVDTTIELIPVTLASVDVASEDINVTLALSQDLLDKYNDTNGTAYVIPDPSIYTIINPSSIVTIAKGTRVGYLMMKFASQDFVGDDPYAFPYMITNVDKPGYIISGNLNKAIAAIGPKNDYDGLYSLRIRTDGWSAFGISDNTPLTYPTSNGKSIGMVTSGPNSVKMYEYVAFGAAGTAIQVAFQSDNVTPTGFGATSPQFTFDPTTNALLSVVNTTGDDGRGRAFHLNPDITDSRYDPDTKTIYAAYIMNQNGRPPQFIYDTLVFTKDR